MRFKTLLLLGRVVNAETRLPMHRAGDRTVKLARADPYRCPLEAFLWGHTSEGTRFCASDAPCTQRCDLYLKITVYFRL